MTMTPRTMTRRPSTEQQENKDKMDFDTAYKIISGEISKRDALFMLKKPEEKKALGGVTYESALGLKAPAAKLDTVQVGRFTVKEKK